MNPVKWFVKPLLLFLLFHLSISFDTITPQLSIIDGDVMISSGKTFALGFFSPSNTKYRYVGIWYYQIPEKTVVWVANREYPIDDTSGTLSISSQGNLVLYQKNETILVWSTNASVTRSKNSVARLLDSGNLVLVRNGTTFWQSFDYPTNTALPSMKIGLNLSSGLNRLLTPWKSPDDPGIGHYTYKIDPSGFPQLFLYKGSVKYWRGGSWTGQRWVGVPEMTRSHIFSLSFVYNNEEISIMVGIKNASIISILVANETGLMRRFTWNPQDQRWVAIWSAPKEECDYYGHCGPNSNCDQTQINKFECSCLPGFEPKSPQTWLLRDWSAGCARKPNASLCQRGEGFVKVARLKVPDTYAANADMSLGLKQCKEKCLRNCSCVAYANAFSERNGGTGCLTWYGDLVDIKTYGDAGQDFYVRVDAVDLVSYKKKGTLSKMQVVAILVVSIAVMLSLVAFACFLVRRVRRGRTRWPSLSFTTSPTRFDDPLNERNTELPLFNLGTIAAATNNLSSDNRLGEGGFGPVYKGTLLNGKEIAVKRLSNSSGQGIEEFKNEVTLIAKLQHRNLVRILGCCIEKGEKMVIYEFLPNKSLDSFIFDERKRSLLDWGRRFEIFCGIARGIVYLHQDSRLRIIHRDLKASNILLDADMNPKISDFGMARIFGGDQAEANTKRVVGTYGYMAPEYAMQGIFSIKSDVYSFGVLLLEIITGRRNSGYYPNSPTSNLIGHVWELWRNGKAMEIIDPSLGGSYPAAGVLKCIQIGLLCVQESATDRPNMSVVVAMLGHDASLPSPKQPAFIINKTDKGDETGSSEGIGSVNEVTLTMPQAR